MERLNDAELEEIADYIERVRKTGPNAHNVGVLIEHQEALVAEVRRLRGVVETVGDDLLRTATSSSGADYIESNGRLIAVVTEALKAFGGVV